jgi:tetratricopeptide (TPR) repeat protein
MKKSLLFLWIVCVPAVISGQSTYDDILRAVSLSDRGEAGKAASLLSGLKSVDSDAGMLVVRGDICLKAGMINEAKRDFMAAENLQHGTGVYGIARCAAAEGDARAAVVWLETHLRSSQRKSEPEILLDNSFKSLSSSPEWKSLWKKEWYKGYERKSWEIEHYLKSGRTDMAVESWEELKAVYPDMPVTDYCQARIMMSRGKYSEAAGILARLTADSDAPAAWKYTLAEAYAGAGSYYAAASSYGKLIDAAYPDPGLLLNRSRMLVKAGDRDAAKRDLLRYLAIDPDDTGALGLMGKTYAEEGAIYEALPYLNANVDKHPGEALAYSLRGDAWMAARSWDRATEDYSMSLDLDPSSGEVNLNLGIALVNNGKTDEACYYLRKAKALGEKEATQYLAKYCIR